MFTSPLFVDVFFLDQMGYTAILNMIVIAIVCWVQHYGKDNEKGILLSKQLFKTCPVFNIGAFAVIIILVALYAAFWK